MSKEIIMHIGSQKTGTTSIQKCLFDNKCEIQNHGFLYPDVLETDINKISHYNSVRGFFSDNIAEISETKKFVSLIRLHNAAKTILSAESMSCFPPKKNGESNYAYWQRKKSMLKTIRQSFEGFDIHVILFTRESRGFLRSLFKQYLKITHNKYTSIERALDSFLANEGHLADHSAQARIWREVFGPPAVTLVDYDELNKKKISAVSAFLQHVGLPDIESQPYRVNVSPDWSILETLRIAKLYGVKQMTPAQFLEGLPNKLRNEFNVSTEMKVRQKIDEFVTNSQGAMYVDCGDT